LSIWFWSMRLISDCGVVYRGRLSHRTVPHPSEDVAAIVRRARYLTSQPVIGRRGEQARRPAPEPGGRPTSDVRAPAGLSRAAHDLSGRIRAIDLNPVAVLPEGHGVRALDALLERPR
jgi:hypothetical protein